VNLLDTCGPYCTSFCNNTSHVQLCVCSMPTPASSVQIDVWWGARHPKGVPRYALKGLYDIFVFRNKLLSFMHNLKVAAVLRALKV
jgi:hypothetical protein